MSVEPGVQWALDQCWLPSRSPAMTQGEWALASSPHPAKGSLPRCFSCAGASWVWRSPSPLPGEPAQEEDADQQEGAAGHCGQRNGSAGCVTERAEEVSSGARISASRGLCFPSPHAAPTPSGFPGRLGTGAGRGGGPGAAWGALPPRAGSFWGEQAENSLQKGSKARPQACDGERNVEI